MRLSGTLAYHDFPGFQGTHLRQPLASQPPHVDRVLEFRVQWLIKQEEQPFLAGLPASGFRAWAWGEGLGFRLGVRGLGFGLKVLEGSGLGFRVQAWG